MYCFEILHFGSHWGFTKSPLDLATFILRQSISCERGISVLASCSRVNWLSFSYYLQSESRVLLHLEWSETFSRSDLRTARIQYCFPSCGVKDPFLVQQKFCLWTKQKSSGLGASLVVLVKLMAVTVLAVSSPHSFLSEVHFALEFCRTTGAKLKLEITNTCIFPQNSQNGTPLTLPTVTCSPVWTQRFVLFSAQF